MDMKVIKLNTPRRFNVTPYYNEMELTLDNIYVTCNVIKTLLNDAKNNNGVTYKYIAVKCDMSNLTVYNLANGRTKEPRMSTVIKILHYFGYRFVARRRN